MVQICDNMKRMTLSDQITPTIGSDRGGLVVTVNGYFQGQDDVYRCRFDTSEVHAQRLSSSSLSCISPPHHNSTVSVGISRDNGKTFTIARPEFSYFNVGSLTRTYASTAGTSVITITGRTIIDSHNVTCVFNDTISVPATVNLSAGTVACPVPEAQNGNTTLTIVGDGGAPASYVFEYFGMCLLESRLMFGRYSRNIILWCIRTCT